MLADVIHKTKQNIKFEEMTERGSSLEQGKGGAVLNKGKEFCGSRCIICVFDCLPPLRLSLLKLINYSSISTFINE